MSHRTITPQELIEGVFKPQKIGGIALFILIASVLATSIYSVPADSKAVVLRFGKVLKTVDPGLNFKLPFGIDRKYSVRVKRQQKLEFGFGTPGATNKYQFSSSYDRWGKKEQEVEKSMITGDKNAALVEWIVQYRITDPEAYTFKVRNPEDTLRDSSESVMREVVGDRTIDEVLTIGRQAIESEALEKLQTLADRYELGFEIDQVQLINVNPPAPVQASFNEVNKAQQEREQKINNAKGEYNKAVPRARGEADRSIAEAEGKATQRVNESLGDAKRFQALLTEYLKAPEVTRSRLYYEKMQEVLPRAKNKYIIDEEVKGLLPLLKLNQ